MKNYIAKRFQNISGGLSLDTEALSRYSDVIDMSIGDTDFITDSRIIDAAFSDARLGYTKYGDPKGDPELIDAVIKAYQRGLFHRYFPGKPVCHSLQLHGHGAHHDGAARSRR